MLILLVRFSHQKGSISTNIKSTPCLRNFIRNLKIFDIIWGVNLIILSQWTNFFIGNLCQRMYCCNVESDHIFGVYIHKFYLFQFLSIIISLPILIIVKFLPLFLLAAHVSETYIFIWRIFQLIIKIYNIQLTNLIHLPDNAVCHFKYYLFHQ